MPIKQLYKQNILNNVRIYLADIVVYDDNVTQSLSKLDIFTLIVQAIKEL